MPWLDADAQVAALLARRPLLLVAALKGSTKDGQDGRSP